MLTNDIFNFQTMDELKPQVCRLCLSVTKNYGIMSNIQQDMIQILIPELNIALCNDLYICEDCNNVIHECYLFKSTCVDIEETIYKYSNDGQIQVNLDKITGLKELEIHDEVEKDTKICRTCLNTTGPSYYIKIDDDECPVELEMLTYSLPEVDPKLTQNPVICKNCLQLLKKQFIFHKKCMESEIRISKHLQDTPDSLKENFKLFDMLQSVKNDCDQDFGAIVHEELHIDDKDEEKPNIDTLNELSSDDIEKASNLCNETGKGKFASKDTLLEQLDTAILSCGEGITFDTSHLGDSSSDDYEKKPYNTRKKRKRIIVENDDVSDSAVGDPDFKLDEFGPHSDSDEDYVEGSDTFGWLPKNRKSHKDSPSKRSFLYKKCKFCHRYISEVLMIQHMVLCVMNPKNRLLVECSHCGVKVLTMQKLQEHMVTCREYIEWKFKQFTTDELKEGTVPEILRQCTISEEVIGVDPCNSKGLPEDIHSVAIPTTPNCEKKIKSSLIKELIVADLESNMPEMKKNLLIHKIISPTTTNGNASDIETNEVMTILTSSNEVESNVPLVTENLSKTMTTSSIQELPSEKVDSNTPTSLTEQQNLHTNGGTSNGKLLIQPQNDVISSLVTYSPILINSDSADSVELVDTNPKQIECEKNKQKEMVKNVKHNNSFCMEKILPAVNSSVMISDENITTAIKENVFDEHESEKVSSSTDNNISVSHGVNQQTNLMSVVDKIIKTTLSDSCTSNIITQSSSRNDSVMNDVMEKYKNDKTEKSKNGLLLSLLETPFETSSSVVANSINSGPIISAVSSNRTTMDHMRLELQQLSTSFIDQASKQFLGVLKCDKCDFNTRHVTGIEQHVLTHFSRPKGNECYLCPVCHKLQSGLFHFITHMKDKHEHVFYKNFYWCVKCADILKDVGQIQFHECLNRDISVKMFKSNGVIFCMKCKFESSSINEAKQHNRICELKSTDLTPCEVIEIDDD